MSPTDIYAPGEGGKGAGLHPVDTRDANNQNLSRRSLIQPSVVPYAATIDNLESLYRVERLALSDGDGVGTWGGEGALGISATQGTSSKQPTYDADGRGGNPSVNPDGTDDAMDIAMPDQGHSEVTLGMWVWDTTDWAGLANLAVGGDLKSWGLRYGSDGNLETMIWDGSGTIQTATMTGQPSLDTWHFIVSRYDGSTLELIVDDTVEATTTGLSGLNAWGHDWLFYRGASDARHWTGRIDQIMAYSRALTDAELTDLFNNT